MSDELRVALERLKSAVDFLDRCRAAGDTAYTTGAMRDAHDWIETAARQVVQHA